MITINTCTYGEYGQCCKITNGTTELVVTTQIGPRIIFFGLCGGENIMYEDKEDLINLSGEYFEKNLAGKGTWHIYGGHRLWKSPEYMDTYYPDNAPVKVELVENGAIFTSEAECTTNIQKSLKIVMAEDGNVTIDHSFTNVGSTATMPISLWSLSVLDKGAKAYIPLSTKDTGFLSNRNLVLWPYTDLNDPRLNITNDMITLEYAPNTTPIKIGALIEDTIVVHTKGLEFTMSMEKIDGVNYPDHDCNVESYTNSIMLEIETLSPLYCIAPGETKVHTIVWGLKKI